ncbi:uncharacterized protein involved in exopolysaccharide biosynthesis/Mrp family chromosome partitioning ATPase [Prosthecomicrobium pneumaticum]|uniref:Uncharacterized protein involved in exopolysaccharide biosynthesis/Mrp family chromosome partitioning ATPase n=1 Tax=Prosthecomicrobium pneumaticum TaxID=81895 RepID=A0A7W9CWG4_9HYPH|nr:uncharacterized protein involved in exopolysaccharide biosynthesis/Mrp family chromosome partitioning ATPase [Prosthecomicrobium pneumaticum]
MRRQRRLILGVAAATVFLVLLLALAHPPRYEARTLILVEAAERSPLAMAGAADPPQDDGGRIDGEVEMLRAPATAGLVIADLGLADPVFAPRRTVVDLFRPFGTRVAADSPEQAEQRARDRLEADVFILRKGATRLIEISARADEAAAAARLANAFAAAHLEMRLAARVGALEAGQRAFDRAAEAAASALSRVEAGLDAFVEKAVRSLPDPAARSRFEMMLAEIDDAEAARTGLGATIAATADLAGRRDWSGLAARISSARLSSLVAERIDLLNRLSAARGTVDLRLRLAALERQLDTEYRAAAADLRLRLETRRSEEEALRARLAEAFEASALTPPLLQRFFELRQAAASNRDLYARALAGSTAFAVERAAQLPESRIVSPALVPGRPASPDLPLVLALSGLGALALGIGAAVLRERHAGGFVDADAEGLDAPVIALLPETAGFTGEALGAAFGGPEMVFGEAVRRLRAALEGGRRVGMRSGRGRVVLVTSAEHEEGKSLVALALGRAFARAGRAALLVDGDFRRPALHRLVGLAPRRGLADHLSGADPEASTAMRATDPASPLRLVLGSAGRRAASEALAESPRLAGLIEESRSAADFVLLDSSPVLAAVDPCRLAAEADLVLLVLRCGRTSRPSARAALAALGRSAPETPVLVVLNRAERGLGRFLPLCIGESRKRAI